MYCYHKNHNREQHNIRDPTKPFSRDPISGVKVTIQIKTRPILFVCARVRKDVTSGTGNSTGEYNMR